ncbi:MAG: hypothetical protein ACM3TU_01110 [Bacillota bacterium]
MNWKPFISLGIALLVLLGCAGLYGFGYYTLVNWKERAASLATDAATKAENIDRITKAHAALSSLASDEATLDTYSVGKEDVAPFLETLQQSGRSQGAHVDIVSVTDQADKKTGHNRIGITLSIRGSFDAVMRTLGAIEYAPYDGVVTNLTLGTGVEDASSTPAGWKATATYSVSAVSPKP